MAALLFLTQRIPYPPIKGEKIRPLQILRHLRQKFAIYLGCFIDDPSDWEHVETVRALCESAFFARLNPTIARLHCLRGLLKGRPLSVEFFRDAGLSRWVNGVLDQVRPEAIFVCSSNMAPYVLEYPREGQLRVVDLADIDSEKFRQYAERHSGPMRWIYAREARLIRQLEIRIAHEVDFSTFVSEPEAQLFRNIATDCTDRIRGISSGVDFDYFDGGRDYPRPYDISRPNYVFTGTMDYPPNVDAVVWFAREILPMVRSRLTDAQFYIVGANPAPAVQRLAATDGVHVTGRVSDVRPYLAHATAGVAPMRIARGIQNKVLEAMAMGKPIVVTPEALEGIDAEPGREVLLAADAQTFAGAVCSLAAGLLGREVGTAARARVVSRYAWGVQLGAFDRLLAQAMRPPASSSDRVAPILAEGAEA